MNYKRYAAYFTLLLLPLALVLVFAPTSTDSTGEPSVPASPIADTTISAERDVFGIRKDAYTVLERRVRRNETFAELLVDQEVPYQNIVELAETARPVFDVRDIRTGRPYRIYRRNASQKTAYLVYQSTPTDYVVFDVQHPERTHTGKRPVAVTWKMTGGTITNSLYETLLDDGAHPGLVLELSEVFAWQIDFFRIRSGDSFQVIYENRSIGDKRLPPGKIIAARFTHRGEDYYAFHFDGGSRSDYFDEAGNSLRRQLLKAPLRFSRISSRFSRRRLHPVTGGYRAHLGTDYAAPTGTPVRTVGDGVVLVAGYDRANGNWVKIRHNSTYTTGYLHLSRIASGIHPGAEVKQGETIGYVGSTGLATGPHLHYHFWKNGTPIDPYNLELPPVEPIYPQYQEEFAQLVAQLKPQLDAMQPPSPVERLAIAR